ncbi:MAG: hypothetical protein OXH63_05930 [Gemmatimonadetes bacterium]|nr:hypothetical protein [Gemmatimonadota bacterium]
MKPIAIRTLYFFTLITVSSTAAAEPKPQYGGFSSHPDSLQVFYDYIHDQEMVKVEAGAELQQVVEAIPVDLSAPIDMKQEAGLRTWLYDFLVAFSASGSDSLAAEFYLREGMNNPDGIEILKKYLASKDTPTDGTPIALFAAGHREILGATKRDYFFENVSFFDSVFKVFEMQEEYDNYAFYLQTHGMIPRGTLNFHLKLQDEVEATLQVGESLVFADIMFIVEEPAGVSRWSWQGRTPSFFRLVWDPERAMWRHVEVYFSRGVPQNFLFNVM